MDKELFFFDEIQNVDGWANFARRLANLKYRVYVTGSNAKMLSRDIETVLGGRYPELTLNGEASLNWSTSARSASGSTACTTAYSSTTLLCAIR